MDQEMLGYSPPPAEYPSLPPELVPPGPEYTPEGAPQPETERPGRRRRRWRFLLYAAAALVYLGLLFKPAGRNFEPSPAPLPPVAETAEPAPDAEPTPTPTAPAEPPSSIPEIGTDFFCFSHEHHGRVYLSNTGALLSVDVTVRDKTLDLAVYEHALSEEEIASGLFELPVLSTGDLYMEHMAEYEAAGTPIPGSGYVSPAWPEFEMTVDARYEADDGSGEATLSRTTEAAFELGFGVSYWQYDWDEQIPQDCFRVVPWEELEEIRYVINDPDAVRDPLTVSVDISFDGRHAALEEYETILYREEYSLFDSDTVEYVPTVGVTPQLLLRRPDWMPERGAVHVVLVQRLASTGELWTREFDYEYGPD